MEKIKYDIMVTYLSQIRQHNKITLKDMSKYLDIPLNLLYNFEYNKSDDFDIFERYMKRFNITYEELYKYASDKLIELINNEGYYDKILKKRYTKTNPNENKQNKE